MKCYFERKLFQNEQTGYSVVVYKTDDHSSVPEKAKSKYPCSDGMTAFTATGTWLPITQNAVIDLKGAWAMGKYGSQLAVESSSVETPKTKEGIAAYLASDLICGIGEKTATLIVDKFGLDTIDIINKQPKLLLSIPGITEEKLTKIMETYNNSNSLRDIVTKLSPYGISVKKSAKIQETFGSHASDIVHTKPYFLCKIAGFGFKTVDEIAKNLGLPTNDPMRIQEGIIYTLSQNQTHGHLFIFSEELCKEAYKLLNEKKKEETVSLSKIEEQLFFLVSKNRCRNDSDRIYLPRNYIAETETGEIIKNILSRSYKPQVIDKLLLESQRELGITLSDKQTEAVKMCFCHQLSIITGGPGTGKTTIIKVIINVYKKLCQGEILLLAPTGRASRKISESSIYPSKTLHSALSLNTDENSRVATRLLADFIVIDECSMMDMTLAWHFFKSIKPTAKILLVGDCNQLPSVGAGNVFREMIECDATPTTVLDSVYRQAKTSRIALNAHSILQNKSQLLYGQDFIFISAETSEESANTIKKLYVKECAVSGLSNTQILSTFRFRGHCGADKLNNTIQSVVNPKKIDKKEITIGFKTFRIRDKVMEMKNKDDVSNGDIGFIKGIEKNKNGNILVTIDFLDGRIITYTAEDMDSVELAYATTIHKSQGSEYDVVIIPLLTESYIMLRRNLIYTAITRAKKKVIIVGQLKALFMAIHKNEIEGRNTALGQRIKD